MEKRNNIDSLTVLFGAGVSIHCNIPTGKNMVEQIVGKIKTKKLAEYFSEIKKHYKQLENKEPDFEDVLVYLDMVQQKQTRILLNIVSKKHNIELNDEIRLAKELKEFFLKELRRICMRFDLEKSRKQYEEFFKLHEKLTLQIFTTNYDPILEEVLNELDLDNYSTNFTPISKGRKTVYHWDAKCNSLDDASIQIAKIHGSISWYKDTETGVIEEIPTLAEISSARNKVQNVMITPTVFKDVYQPPYYLLYDRFNQTVKKSEIVVIVGHSLRDEWIYGGIRDFLEKKNHVIYVSPVSKSEQIDVIKKLMEYETFIYFETTCLKFLPELVTTLNNTLETSKISETIRNISYETKKEKIETKKRKSKKKNQAKIAKSNEYTQVQTTQKT